MIRKIIPTVAALFTSTVLVIGIPIQGNAAPIAHYLFSTKSSGGIVHPVSTEGISLDSNIYDYKGAPVPEITYHNYINAVATVVNNDEYEQYMCLEICMYKDDELIRMSRVINENFKGNAARVYSVGMPLPKNKNGLKISFTIYDETRSVIAEELIEK